MNAFSIGTSALSVAQRGLELVGQNIANATTPGYKRQTLSVATRSVGTGIGVGVEVKRFVRSEAPPLRTAILVGNSQQAAAEVRLDSQRQIESALGDTENSLGTQIETFFNSVERATARPADTVIRREVISSADTLAKQFNIAATDLKQLQRDIGTRLESEVSDVNTLTKRIAELNGKISSIEIGGVQANDLRDQRDQLVDDLSKKIGFRVTNGQNGAINLFSDVPLVFENTATTLVVGATTPNDRFLATASNPTQPLDTFRGSSKGLLDTYNTDIPNTLSRLDSLAAEFAKRIDSAQATGLSLSGPVTSALGTRGVTNPAAPLATQNLPIAPQAGTLTISITDVGANTRTSAAITIDPATQSLNDVAAAITTGTGGQVQATVNPTTNTLEFQAQSGFAFDFAGRPDSPPAGQFDPPTVANPDSANLLAATGINTLFRGSSATTLEVRSEILANPNLLASSRSGRSGDGTNLERIGGIRDEVAFAGTRTLSQEFADITSQVGGQVRSLDDFTNAQEALNRNLSNQEQSVVGVDVNEELLKLLDYQRMTQMASRYLSVVNEALDSIIQIV